MRQVVARLRGWEYGGFKLGLSVKTLDIQGSGQEKGGTIGTAFNKVHSLTMADCSTAVTRLVSRSYCERLPEAPEAPEGSDELVPPEAPEGSVDGPVPEVNALATAVTAVERTPGKGAVSLVAATAMAVLRPVVAATTVFTFV